MRIGQSNAGTFRRLAMIALFRADKMTVAANGQPMKRARLRLMWTRVVWLCTLLMITGIGAGSAIAVTPSSWIATWGSSQMAAWGVDNFTKQSLNGATLRQTVRVSLGGEKLRLRLSNAFGDSPLVLRSISIGPSGKAGLIDPHTQIPVLFSGNTSVMIPAGAEYLSDAVVMNVPALSDVTITMLIERAPHAITTHSGAHATSLLELGNHVLDVQLSSPESFTHWFFLGDIEVQGTANMASVVTFGDSITDGHGSTTDANNRWPDVLAARLSKAHIGVVNRGIGGNRVLQDGLGPNALARFDRDVLATPGARYLIVLEGINDIGGLDRTERHPIEAHNALVREIEAAYVQIVARAHSQGIAVFGATVTAFRDSDYYHPSDQTEADRNALNGWIRTSGVFDAIIDFDKVTRDPLRPDHLDPAVDCGDHLHPNPTGYKRMGELIPLELFR